MSTAKATLYDLIDQLPENAIGVTEKLLRVLIADFPQSEPIIIEPLIDPSEGKLRPEFLKAVIESEKDIETGQTKSWTEVKRNLGL